MHGRHVYSILAKKIQEKEQKETKKPLNIPCHASGCFNVADPLLHTLVLWGNVKAWISAPLFCAGMNFYKVNRKTGRLIELTTGLQMGEGVEITLSPGKSTTIKVCMLLINVILLLVTFSVSWPRPLMPIWKSAMILNWLRQQRLSCSLSLAGDSMLCSWGTRPVERPEQW